MCPCPRSKALLDPHAHPPGPKSKQWCWWKKSETRSFPARMPSPHRRNTGLAAPSLFWQQCEQQGRGMKVRSCCCCTQRSGTSPEHRTQLWSKSPPFLLVGFWKSFTSPFTFQQDQIKGAKSTWGDELFQTCTALPRYFLRTGETCRMPAWPAAARSYSPFLPAAHQPPGRAPSRTAGPILVQTPQLGGHQPGSVHLWRRRKPRHTWGSTSSWHRNSKQIHSGNLAKWKTEGNPRASLEFSLLLNQVL